MTADVVRKFITAPDDRATSLHVAQRFDGW
jgi:hypothetical protein